MISKTFTTGVFITIVCLLLASICEAKKVKKGKEKEVKVRVAREIAIPKLNPSQPKPPVVPIVEVESSADGYLPEEPNEEYVIVRKDELHRPVLRKPKSLRVLTAYEVCKQQCQKQRDQESTKEYIERLRQELKMIEDHLQTEENSTVTEQGDNV